MDKKKTWDLVKLMLKIAFTALALWLVYTKVDLRALEGLWKKANGWYFIPAVIAFIITQLISAYRNLLFFRNIEVPVSPANCIKLYWLGMFYNLFLPGGIGGDGYKVIALKRQFETTHKEVFGAVFFDRLSGLWALGFLLAVFSSFLPEVSEYRWWIIAVFLAGSIAYYAVLYLFFKRMVKRFIQTHLLAFLVQSFQLITVFFILQALGCNTSYWPYFAIFLLSSLASVFPLSIGGLGAREVAIVWGAATFHLDKDIAVSVSLCFYCITMLTALLAVFILFNKKNNMRIKNTTTSAE